MDSAQDLKFNNDAARVSKKVKDLIHIAQKKMLRSQSAFSMLLLKLHKNWGDCMSLPLYVGTLLCLEPTISELPGRVFTFNSARNGPKVAKISASTLFLNAARQAAQKLSELIVQYNNKRRECEHLKSQLFAVQKEITKLKRESVNLSNMIKREMQSASYNENQQQLEQKIEKKDIQIASDKSHPEQVKCKLKDMEENYTAKVMEAELVRCGVEDAERPRPNSSASSNLETNRLNANPGDVNRNEPTRMETNSNNRSRVELNPKESSLVDPPPGNFVSLQPSQLSSVAVAQETRDRTRATAVNEVVRKCDSLQREVANLKRQFKNRRTQNTSDSQPVGCCPLALLTFLPNVFPNVQVDRMTKLFNRMMSFASKCNSRGKVKKFSTQSKKRAASDKKARKVKSRKFTRAKRSKKSKNCGSSNWDVESSDCGAENDQTVSANASNSTKPHVLRVKRRHAADSPVTPYNVAASKNLLPVNNAWEASFAEMQTNSSESIDKTPEKVPRPESDFHQESTVEVPVATKIPDRNRGKHRRNNPEVGDQLVKSKILSDESSILSDSIASDPEISVPSQNSALGESAQNSREGEHSDGPLEIVSDSEPYLEYTNLRDRVEMRKRKRSDSTEAEKRTGRENLTEKLQAVKSPTSPTRNSTELSSREDSEEARKMGKSRALASSDDPGVCLPAKKQCIAHVSIKASSPLPYEQGLPASSEISKLCEPFGETYKSTHKNSKDDRAVAATTRPLTRPLAVEILAQSNTKNDGEGGRGVEIGRLGLPVSVMEICRRAGLPTRRNAVAANAQQSLPSYMKKVAVTADSPEVESKFGKVGETPTLPKVRADPSDDAKSSQASLESRAGEHESNSAKAPEPRKDKFPRFAPSELAQAAENSAVHSNRAKKSVTPSILTADAPVDESEVARVLPAEKPSDSLNTSSASPAASFASLDSASSKPAAISIPSSLLAILTNAAAIVENNELNARRGDEDQNMTVLSGADSTIPDESPASPSSSPASPDMTETEEHPSIYNSAALSISLEEDNSDSTLSILTISAENASISDQLSFQDISNNPSIEKTFDRSLTAHNANSHDDSEDEYEEFSKNIVNPQFFVEASAAAKESSAQSSSGFAAPINSNEFRSRLVLYSPSKSPSHQNPLRTPSSWNDEAQTAASSAARVSLPTCYSRMPSLETMLNNHLSQKKTAHATKAMKLRRAAAIKLQETVEKNVRSELVKLVESNEWTSELYQSVVTNLLDTRNEYAVAKSITDYLIERAALREPLDLTYTPPAPIMTKCQQKIVTLVTDLARDDAMPRIFDLVQAGIEYNLFKLGGCNQPIDNIEYLVRIFTAISRIRKDRERIRIFCCDVFYFLGRKALPAIHVILTIWPEVMPKHGTVGNELTNCFAHLIKVEIPGNNPLPKVMALKQMITGYYKYPHFQAQSDVVMKVLLKALHEKYSSDLETSILLISKREGTKWALDNVINKGLMTIIRDDSYQWQYEAVSLLGLLLRCIPVAEAGQTLQKYVDLLCHILNTGEGSYDKQEGALSALLSLSRYNTHFLKISVSVLKWTPSRGLRASTMERLHGFFDSHKAAWWMVRDQHTKNTSGRNNCRT